MYYVLHISSKVCNLNFSESMNMAQLTFEKKFIYLAILRKLQRMISQGLTLVYKAEYDRYGKKL